MHPGIHRNSSSHGMGHHPVTGSPHQEWKRTGALLQLRMSQCQRFLLSPSTLANWKETNTRKWDDYGSLSRDREGKCAVRSNSGGWHCAPALLLIAHGVSNRLHFPMGILSVAFRN